RPVAYHVEWRRGLAAACRCRDHLPASASGQAGREMDENLKVAQVIQGLPSPELRKDPIVGRWVIIATDRAERPVPPKGDPLPPVESCPFCEGNEKHTPHEILAYRSRGTRPDEPGWRVRVVPNKYPALQIEGELNKRGDGIYDRMHGIGAHE